MFRLPNRIAISKKLLFLLITLKILIIVGISIPLINHFQLKSQSLNTSQNQQNELQQKVAALGKELETFKSEDQYQRNQKLELEITNIKKSYSKSSDLYTSIIDLRDQKQKTDKLED